MEERIRTIISENLLDESGRAVLLEVPSCESLIEAGLLDSLGVVQLVSHLEREFEIVFDPMDINLENLESIDKIVALVEARRASA